MPNKIRFKRKDGQFMNLTLMVLSCLFTLVPSLRVVTVFSYGSILFIVALVAFIDGGVLRLRNIHVSMEGLFLCGFVFLSIISITYSLRKSESVKFCMVLFTCCLLYGYFSHKENWMETFRRVLLIFSLCYAIITIISSINFPLFMVFFSPIMSESSIRIATSLQRNTHAYSGILGQTGVNAFAIYPLVVISFFNICKKISLIRNIFYLILGSWALILTRKRGVVIWGILALLIVYCLQEKKYDKNPSKVLRVLLLITGLMVVVYIASTHNLYIQEFLERFKWKGESDISSGRFALYEAAWDVIKKYPFGIGINAYSAVYGENVHNDFLQIAAEIGVAGSIMFFGFYIVRLVKGVKKYLIMPHTDGISWEIFLTLLIYQMVSCMTSFPIHSYGFCIQIFIYMASIPALEKWERKNYEDRNCNI